MTKDDPMTDTTPRTVLIAGASRGLGLGLAREFRARGWSVIATERAAKPSLGLRALADEAKDGVRIEALDVTDAASIAALADKLAGTALDLLFVNAGVSDDPTQTVGEITTEEFVRVMTTNALAPLKVIEAFAPRVAPEGTIAAMSSTLGSIELPPNGNFEVYGASKAALNKLLKSYAARAGGKRTILALMPGWVRTEMGGSQAPLDVETSARGLADTILAHAGAGGIAFVDYRNKTVPW